jgi:hypothetical protein
MYRYQINIYSQLLHSRKMVKAGNGDVDIKHIRNVQNCWGRMTSPEEQA